MKPRFYHHAAAHFVAITAQGGGIVFVALVSIACAPALNGHLGWRGVALIACAVGAAYALGALIGTIILGVLFGKLVIRIQGGPFQVGDQVTILRGKRSGQTTEIYEVWKDRAAVRLRLTADEAQTAADVYSDCEIMRVTEHAIAS